MEVENKTIPQHMDVTEIASEGNFNEEFYLMFNPDLQAAKKNSPAFSVEKHFYEFGIQEQRKTLNPNYVSFRDERYGFFSDVLDIDPTKYNFENNKFPIISKKVDFSISQYDGESANGIASWMWDEISRDPSKKFLDIGCGFRHTVQRNCLYLEVYPSFTADLVVSPNTKLPIKDQSLDGVLCLAVLEHTDDPNFVASEIKRILKPGGTIMIDWPFLQPVHGYPYHYYNATAMGLKKMFEGDFNIISLETGGHQSADATVSWILGWFSEFIEDPDLKNEFLNTPVKDLLGHEYGSDYFKRFLNTMNPENISKLACGNTLFASKKKCPDENLYTPTQQALKNHPEL